jgi:uncharacterized protein YpbB
MEAISQQVNRAPATVEGHIVALVERGVLPKDRFVDSETVAEIRRISGTLGGESRLRLIKDAMDDQVSWLQIRVALVDVGAASVSG